MTRASIPFSLCLGLLSLATTAIAQPAGSPGPLTTDRPTVSASSSVVPPGFLQVEVGLTHYQDESGGVKVGRTESLVTSARFGWLDVLELQLNYLGVVDVSVETEFEDGLALTQEGNGSGDLDLGAKWRLWKSDTETWASALAFGMTLPTGDAGYGTEQFDPRAVLTFGGAVSDRLSLDLNLGLDLFTTFVVDIDVATEETFVDLVQSVALGYALNDFVSVTGEVASFVNTNQSAPPANLVLMALAVRLRDGFQLDGSFGLGTNDSAVDWFGGLGLAFRLPE